MRVGAHAGAGASELLEKGRRSGRQESMPAKYGRSRGALSLKLARGVFKKTQDGWAPPVDLSEAIGAEGIPEGPPVKPSVSPASG